MPVRKRVIRRPIGRAGIIRRIPIAVREAVYQSIIELGKESVVQYKKRIRAGNHKRKGLLLKAITMRRSRRYLQVWVGVLKTSSARNLEQRKDQVVSPAQKSIWLEFGTKKGKQGPGQRPRPILLPIHSIMRHKIPNEVRFQYNTAIDRIFARLGHSNRLFALRNRLRL